MRSKNFLIVIAGPTAVGKTALCVDLAKTLNCDIISADSRQFYKELSIGTAKPSLHEMKGVPHHFVNFISIEQEFSAGKFELSALDLLKEIYKKNNKVIMTGGSGLYIQAVCLGMNDIPDIDLRFRDELYDELEIHGLDTLLEELKMKDPEYYATVDRNNPQRVIRALEICRGTGEPYSSFRTDQPVKRDFNIIKIGLEREREELFERIDRRMDEMIKSGLFQEAKKLYAQRKLNALKTVGYKEIFSFIDGLYDREETVRLLKRNSRRYAKRQLTWFKKDPGYAWFHPGEKIKILTYLQKEIGLI